MLGYGFTDKLIMDVQQPQHVSFVSAHLAAEAHDVSEQERS
jgi:hypothetical protein